MGGAKFAKALLRLGPVVTLLAGCALPPNGQSPGTLPAGTPRSDDGPAISLPRPSSTPTPASDGQPSPTDQIYPDPAGLHGAVLQIEMFDETSGWAVAHLGEPPYDHVLRTMDGGVSWDDVTPPEAFENLMSAIPFFASPDSAWVVYSDRVWEHDPHPLIVWRTQDGGRTWVPSDAEFPLSESDFPEQIQFVGDQRGWLLITQPGMSVHGAFVATTDDGGSSWSRVGYPDEPGSEGDMGCTKTLMSFRDLAVGWIVGDCAFGVYFKRTSDGGKTWSDELLAAPSGRIGDFVVSKPRLWPDPAEGEIVTVVVSSFGGDTAEGWLMVSLDGGNTWSTSEVPKPFGVEFFLDSSVGWFAGSDGYDYQGNGESSLYQTRDGGQTWSLLSILKHVSQLDCVNERTCWALTGPWDARILMRTNDGGATWVDALPASQVATSTARAAVPWQPCFDAPASRVLPGMDAYISYDPSLANRLRTEPDLNEGDVITSIPPGARVHVNFGPRCNQQLVWWNVTVYDTGSQGWTAEGDGRSSWLISGTPTPTPGVTPSRTPFPTSAGPEVIDVDPHEIILRPGEFPEAGLTTLAVTDRRNSEILVLRGEDAGALYLEESGRILGVSVEFEPENPDSSSLPNYVSILLVLFKSRSGPAFLLTEKGGPCREEEGRFQLQYEDLGLGDVSVLCTSGQGDSWVRVGYRNVYFDVGAVSFLDPVEDEWLIEAAAAQFQKLLAFPTSGSVSISPGD